MILGVLILRRRLIKEKGYVWENDDSIENEGASEQ